MGYYGPFSHTSLRVLRKNIDRNRVSRSGLFNMSIKKIFTYLLHLNKCQCLDTLKHGNKTQKTSIKAYLLTSFFCFRKPMQFSFIHYHSKDVLKLSDMLLCCLWLAATVFTASLSLFSVHV